MNRDPYLSRAMVNQAIRATLYKASAKGVVALLVLLFISAVSVVYVKHRYRQDFIDLQKAQAKKSQLQREWNQLLLEETTWASYSRIEQVATTQMRMVYPKPDQINILDISAQ